MLDQTQTSAATLEPLVWQAIRAAIPESLEIMGENKQVLAWLEYRSPSRGWVSTDPVSATRDQLEQRRKRFTMHTARIAEGLTPQEFLEYATTLRKLECNRAEHAQQLEVFVKLLRADHQTSDLEQIESLMRQLLSSSTMGKSIEAGGS